MQKQTILKTFKRGAWITHVIKVDELAGHTNYVVRIDAPNNINTYWPIKYHNGEIGYDGTPPRDCQRATKAAYKWLDKWLDVYLFNVR